MKVNVQVTFFYNLVWFTTKTWPWQTCDWHFGLFVGFSFS